MLWWPDSALGPDLRRVSIWPCGPGERKEGLADHQDSPSGPFPNYRVSIQMLGSQEEIQTKRKMHVLYCWIQELSKLLIICMFECAHAVSIHAHKPAFGEEGTQSFHRSPKRVFGSRPEKCSLIERFNCV